MCAWLASSAICIAYRRQWSWARQVLLHTTKSTWSSGWLCTSTTKSTPEHYYKYSIWQNTRKSVHPAWLWSSQKTERPYNHPRSLVPFWRQIISKVLKQSSDYRTAIFPTWKIPILNNMKDSNFESHECFFSDGSLLWLGELRAPLLVHTFFGVVPSRTAQTAFVPEL